MKPLKNGTKSEGYSETKPIKTTFYGVWKKKLKALDHPDEIPNGRSTWDSYL